MSTSGLPIRRTRTCVFKSRHDCIHIYIYIYIYNCPNIIMRDELVKDKARRVLCEGCKGGKCAPRGLSFVQFLLVF